MVDLKSNLLRKDLSKLNFCIQVVVCVEVLTQFWSPLCFQLLGYRCNSDRINFDVDFRNLRVVLKSPEVVTNN